MADAPHPPSTSSTAELLYLCGAERLELEQRVLVLRRQLRERASELTALEQRLDVLTALEQRLDVINESEELLRAEPLGQPRGLRLVK